MSNSLISCGKAYLCRAAHNEPKREGRGGGGGKRVFTLNPLTPRSDQHVTSPYNIHTLSSKQVMRKLKLRQVEVVILIYHKNSCKQFTRE